MCAYLSPFYLVSREFFSLLVSRSTSSWMRDLLLTLHVSLFFAYMSWSLAKPSTLSCLLFFVALFPRYRDRRQSSGFFFAFSLHDGCRRYFGIIYGRFSMLQELKFVSCTMSSAILCCPIINAVCSTVTSPHAGVCSTSSARHINE